MIQPIGSADLVAVVALWQEAGLIRPWNDPLEGLRRALAGPASTVLGGSEDGLLVATGMVGHDGPRGWVYYPAVRPQSRRRGHGATMMRACEQWLKERGFPKLNVMVRGDKADAHGFYVGMNYARDDVTVLPRRLD